MLFLSEWPAGNGIIPADLEPTAIRVTEDNAYEMLKILSALEVRAEASVELAQITWF